MDLFGYIWMSFETHRGLLLFSATYVTVYQQNISIYYVVIPLATMSLHI